MSPRSLQRLEQVPFLFLSFADTNHQSKREIARARSLLCQLAVNKLGYSRAEVARFLGVTSVPFLIGFEDILTELAPSSDLKSKTAYLK